MCPAVFRFEEAHCGVESQPVAIWCVRFEGLWMDIVHHDVNMKVLLVVVRDNDELMVPVWQRESESQAASQLKGCANGVRTGTTPDGATKSCGLTFCGVLWGWW